MTTKQIAVNGNDNMNISTMTTQDIMDRMGSLATETEAEAMREMLERTDYTDTSEIPDAEWFQMVAACVA